MSIEKSVNYPDTRRKETNNQDPIILKDLFNEAIMAEKYENAGVLKSFIESGKDIESLIAELPGALASKDSSKCLVLNEIKEAKKKSFWLGQDIVDISSLSALLNLSPENPKELDNRFNRLMIDLKEEKDLLEIDFFIALNNYREQMKVMVDLSKEKFENIWEPYREKHNLKAEQYKEFNTTYFGSESNEYLQKSFYHHSMPTMRQLQGMDEIPNYMIEPLTYWQNIYDNSRKLVDKFDEAISKMGIKKGNRLN